MHNRIAGELVHNLAGVRFSFTPYTDGWARGSMTGPLDRTEFIADFANMLRTYAPAIKSLGTHKETGVCIELRNSPILETLKDSPHAGELPGGRYFLRAGPYTALLTVDPANLRVATVVDIENGEPRFDHSPEQIELICSERLRDCPPSQILAVIHDIMSGTTVGYSRSATMWKLENADGPYYSIDPLFHPEGTFRNVNIYPKTDARSRSGYIDGTRTLLNELVGWKQRRGIPRRARVEEVSWNDVADLSKAIRTAGTTLADIQSTLSEHILNELSPMFDALVYAVRSAGLPAALIFDPGFLIDTGQIVNQGSALGLFRGLARTADEPMTPREERGYGRVSQSSSRGTIWRLRPILPQQLARGSARARHGGKNVLTPNSKTAAASLTIEELDPKHLRNIDRVTGAKLESVAFGDPYYNPHHIAYERSLIDLLVPGIAHE